MGQCVIFALCLPIGALDQIPTTMSSDPHICSVGEANIYRSDLESLTKGHWITDAVLDFAKEYFLEQLEEEVKAKISIVSPVFRQMLGFCSTREEVASLCSDFGIGPSKWTLFLLNNSFDSERAYSGTHWTLLVYSPVEQRFSIYDSLSDSASRLAASEIVDAVNLVLGAPEDNLSIEDAHAARQENSSDCGLYAIEHMAAVIEAVKNGNPRVPLRHITPTYIDGRREEWKKTIVERATSQRRI
uniref:ULP_PROTEASE domain-containing protein n=1 Tax=Steinernema glaseri TaxID=37863 RepID=A0A1I7Z3X1_9BILA